jgi:hypothetical protein
MNKKVEEPFKKRTKVWKKEQTALEGKRGKQKSIETR